MNERGRRGDASLSFLIVYQVSSSVLVLPIVNVCCLDYIVCPYHSRVVC